MRPNLPSAGSSKGVESYRLVEALRQRHMTGRRIAVGLAALIYLRWLDFQDAEQAAIAAFEGRDPSPLLAERARWRNWTEARGDDTAGRFFLAELRDALGNCLPIGSPEWRALSEGLSAFSRDPDILASEDECDVELAVTWLKARPFDTPGDRRRLLHAYDEILAGCEGLPDGIHRTPPELARLVAGLAAPAAGERLYDPCLGTAGLLTAVLDAVGPTGPGARPVGDSRMLGLSGAELGPDTLMIALARLTLAGVQAPSLALGNSLERLPPDNVADGFDLVLADPPMGMRVEPQGLGHLPVPTRDSTSLFVQHAIQQLGPRGWALVIVPQGFLFRRGPEARLRERLVRNHQIEAVVGLPPGAYGPGAGIRIAILVLHREGGDGRIRMVDGEAAMKALGLRPNEGLDPRANAAIVEAAQGASESEVAWSVDAEDLAALDWDLTPQRRDLSALDRTLDDLPEGAGRVSLGAIAEVVSGASIPAGVLAYERSEERSIPYLRIGDVQQGRVMAPKGWVAPEAAKGAYRLRPGDLLVSKSGTIGKVAWVGEREVGAVAGSGFYCLRPDRDRIDSRYLAAYLQADTCRAWLKDRGTGSTIAHLPIGAIRDLPVPLPPIPVQERVARAFAERGEDAVAALRRILEVESNDLDTPAVRDWMAGLLDQAPDLPGDGLDPSNAVAALTEWLRERPPVRRCGTCGIPYSVLDAGRNPEYVGPPHDYARGVGTTCLSCWLGLEPGEGAGHAPAGGLLDWAIAFDDALRPLQGMASIPLGPALLALIQDARRRFSALGPLLRDDPTPMSARLPLVRTGRTCFSAGTKNWARSAVR